MEVTSVCVLPIDTYCSFKLFLILPFDSLFLLFSLFIWLCFLIVSMITAIACNLAAFYVLVVVSLSDGNLFRQQVEPTSRPDKWRESAETMSEGKEHR